MSCIFRVSGDGLDVDALILRNKLAANRIWRRGEPRLLKGRIHSNAGANYIASQADLDQFEIQIQETIVFLEKNLSEILAIACFPGVDDARLDFGVVYQENFVESTYLSPKLLKLIAQAGIGVEISRYASRTDDQS
ncbi:hypothetical protein [Solimicrobium silvestre]|uniref:DUF4279 domain-containing protein n=1 Tax=Solimicrobium silvestre TaxID=2099400 RepID=A0A2S9GYE3_9BURK|nr:hypothetical protein [Solimicrobium silvestre]PRC92731.1 hypothetical protein S2091_2461 [Solimicrobium silvestre]